MLVWCLLLVAQAVTPARAEVACDGAPSGQRPALADGFWHFDAGSGICGSSAYDPDTYGYGKFDNALMVITGATALSPAAPAGTVGEYAEGRGYSACSATLLAHTQDSSSADDGFAQVEAFLCAAGGGAEFPQAGATQAVTYDPDRYRILLELTGALDGITYFVEVDMSAHAGVGHEVHAMTVWGGAFGDAGPSTLTIASAGGAGVGDVTVRDPDGVEAMTCNVDAGTTSGTCSGDLDGNKTYSLTASPDPYSYFVGWTGPCAAATAATCDVALSAGQAATVGVIFEALPAFSKAFFPNSIEAGQTSTWMVTIDNSASGQPVTGLNFRNNLRSNANGDPLAVADPANAMSTGCGDADTINAAPGGSSLVYSGGAVAAWGTCTISLNVTATAAGTYDDEPISLNSDQGSTDVAAAAALEVLPPPLPIFTKVFSPAAIGAGGTATLTFTIDNSASSVAAGSLTFSDDFPTGSGTMTIASPANLSPGCGGSVTATAGTASLALADGSVPAGETCTIAVDVTADTAGVYDNITSELESDSGFSAAATATLEVVRAQPAPGFSKAFSPSTIDQNGISRLIFTIDNTASVLPATALAFDDIFPANMALAADSALENTCGGTLTYPSAIGGEIGFSGGEVAAGATCTIAVDLTATVANVYDNTTTDLTSSLGNSGTASAALSVIAAPRTLWITGGGDGSGTVTFGVLNTLFDFICDIDTGSASGTCSNTVDGSAMYVISAEPDAGSEFGGFGGCEVVNSNQCIQTVEGSDETVEVRFARRIVDLAVSVTDDPDPVAAGGLLTYTVTVENLDPEATAPAVAVDLTLPADVVFVATSGECADPSDSGRCDLGDIGSSASASFTVAVDVLLPGGGELSFEAEATTPAEDANTANNSARERTTVTAAPAPSFGKAFSDSPIEAGAVTTLTFEIDNSGSLLPADALAFIDDLPANGGTGTMLVADPANARSDCGGTLTAAPGGNSIALAAGSVAAGASCTIEVDVATDAAGTFVNTTGALSSSLGDSGTATATLAALAIPPAFSKAFSPAAIVAGGTTTLTFTINNTSPLGDTASALAFDDPLPAGMVVAPAPAVVDDCGGLLQATAGAASLSYSGGVLPLGGSCEISVDVIVHWDGTFHNLTGRLESSVGSSAAAEADLAVQAPTGTITIRKTIAPYPAAGDGSFDFSLTGPSGGVATPLLVTAGGEAEWQSLPLNVGAYTVSEIVPETWVLADLDCRAGAARVGTYSEATATVAHDGLTDITCTFVNGRDGDYMTTRTSRLIRNFASRRADMLTANEPDLLSRLTRRGTVGAAPLGGSLSFAPDGTFTRFSMQATTSLSWITSAHRAARALAANDVALAALPGAGSLGDPAGAGLADNWADGSARLPSAPEIAETDAALFYNPTPVASAIGAAGAAGASPDGLTGQIRPGFDIWADGRFAHAEYDTASSDVGLLYVGADYLVTPSLLVGVMGQIDWMEEEDAVEGTAAEGIGWMAGPYVVARLFDGLYFDGRVAGGQSFNSVNPLGSYEDAFDTERWLARGQLTGSFAAGNLTISPHVRAVYFGETQAAYDDSLGNRIPEQTISIGRLVFGPTISYAFHGPGAVVEPHIGVEGIWDFDPADQIDLATGLSTLSSDALRARVAGGLVIRLDNGWSLLGEGFYDGIGVDGIESYGGKARVTIPLN